MVSSVWIGSGSASAVYNAGLPATDTTVFNWFVGSEQGVTVSAQAALSRFGYDVDPSPQVPQGTASALIRSYRLGAPSLAFVPVNAPTLNNVENVIEILFELSASAWEGAGTAVGATMVGTVFIQ
jgi:hypothetical protein